MNNDAHLLSIDEILSRYNIKPMKRQGYCRKMDKHYERKNIIEIQIDKPTYKQIILIVKEPINILLISVSILLSIIYFIDPEEKERLTVVIFTVLIMIMNICIEIYQSKRINDFYKSNIRTFKCRVYREGKLINIPKEELMKGDILDLRSGDIIGADARIIKSRKLKIDESQINGNYNLISKCVISSTIDYEKAENMVFAGSLVSEGTANAVVVEIGEKTKLGCKLVQITKGTHRKLKLYEDLDAFFYGSFFIATAINIVFIIVAEFTTIGYVKLIDVLIGVYIAILPEGIPAIVKMLLYRSANKLKKRDVYVQNLEYVELLGDLTLICADKEAIVAEKKLACDYIYDGENLYDLEMLISDLIVGTEQIIDSFGKMCLILSNYNSIQSRIDSALKDFAQVYISICNGNINSLPNISVFDLDEVKVVEKICKKYSYLYFIGDPDIIISNSIHIKSNGNIQSLTLEKKENILLKYKELSKKGYIIKAISSKKIKRNRKSRDYTKSSFEFLVCFKNVEKPGVVITKSLLKIANIKIIIASNNTKEELRLIGEDIFDFDIKEITDSNDLSMLEPENILNKTYIIKAATYFNFEEKEKLKILYLEKIIFSEANSLQKLRIVNDLQNIGHIVGFIGEISEDSQSLNKSDVGICFENSIEICKESSKIILPSRKFESLIYGLEEGRLFFINFKKVIKYILMHITPQIVPFIFYICFGTPLLISPILLFFLSYVIEVGPAIYFSYETPEINLVDREPKYIDNIKKYTNEEVIQIDDTNISRKNIFYETWKNFVELIKPGRLYSSDILSWSILEAGLITAAGCMFSFFITLYQSKIPSRLYFFNSHDYFKLNSPSIILENGEEISADEQLKILYSGQTTYFLGLLICQFCNMLICRRTYRYFFENFSENPRLLIASIIGIILTTLIIYLPFFEEFLLVRPPNLLALLAPLSAGISILLLDTTKKYLRKQRRFYHNS